MMKKQITFLKGISIFVIFTVYFYFLLFTLLPLLKSNFSIHPALYWFITAYFLFIPIFVYAVIATIFEGNKDKKSIFSALNIRVFTKKDWLYSIGGILLTFILTGVIFGISLLLNKYFGVRMLDTTPWFMKMEPFYGLEKLYLLIWLPMFFFNIVGEEILWRGYIQSRLNGKYAWLLCSFLWLLFHIPFGMDMVIMVTPIILIAPYLFDKTKNTLVGIFIHGIFNGPIFVAIALGLIK